MQCRAGFVQPGSHYISIAVRPIDEIEKSEEDSVIRGKLRIQHHVKQPDILCARARQIGHAAHGRQCPALRVKNAHPAGKPFGEENLSVRKECEAPWRRQIVDQRAYFEGS